MQEIAFELPKEYHILQESIDFIIPGFTKHTGNKTLALRQRDCAQWYHDFVDRLVEACGNQFLPVIKIGDGEFSFVLGKEPIDKRLPCAQKLRRKLGQLKWRFKRHGAFEALTMGHYHSGRYTAEEWRKARGPYAQMIKTIGEKGILALRLNYSRIPMEPHFAAIGRWLRENHINLNDDNYFPCYFVYAALTGSRRGELLKNRVVLVVNGAQGEKRQKIEEGLRREGVADVLWCQISMERSLYDSVNIVPFIGKTELALVGAGIGKPNILLQLEPLQIPCIDAGYIFEIWADSKNKFKRVWCATDEEWDEIVSDPISAGI